MADLTGKTIGNYRVMEQIGRGGMATVFKAYQPSLERYVAIKVIHDSLVSEDEEFVRRFQREAKMVASLRHPNIVQVYDFGVEDNIPYMVMEYLEGHNLKAELNDLAQKDQTMTFDEVLRVFDAIAGALEHAHRQGMIHRDIKPANVFLTHKGDVILTDFGVARIAGSTQYTSTGAVIGTPAYMSPEQCKGERGDERSDIYALGIMLYEMVTGCVPYNADTPLAVILKHISDPLPLPQKFNPTIPDGVIQVILKSLAKAPADRYAHVSEMAQALRNALETNRSSGVPPLPATPPTATGMPPLHRPPAAIPIKAEAHPSKVSASHPGLRQAAPDARPSPYPLPSVGEGERGQPSEHLRPAVRRKWVLPCVGVAILALVIVAAVAGIAALSQLTGGPSATPTPRNLIFKEDFTEDGDLLSSTQYWDIGETSDDYSDDIGEIVAGRYRRTIYSKLPVFWSEDLPKLADKGHLRLTPLSEQNFLFSVDVTLVESSAQAGDTAFAILFRKDEAGNYYQVEFRTDNTYSVQMRNEGVRYTLQTAEECLACQLEPEIVNTFGILTQDDQFTVYANGLELTTIGDSTLTGAGAISLGLEAAYADTTLVVDFDNILVQRSP